MSLQNQIRRLFSPSGGTCKVVCKQRPMLHIASLVQAFQQQARQELHQAKMVLKSVSHGTSK